jgi:hypothetical membrane protein
LAAVAEGFFAAVVVFLDIVDPAVSSRDGAVSDLVHGRFGALLAVALVVHGLGVLTLVAALRRLPSGTGRRFQAGLWALVGAGACILLVGLFPTDPAGAPRTLVGLIHTVTAIVSFLLLPVAFLALSGRLRSVPALRTWVTPLAATSAVVTVALGVSATIRHLGGFGIVERLAIAVNTAWILAVAVVLTRSGAVAPAPREL